MMSQDNIPAKPSDDKQNSGNDKLAYLKPPEQGLRCPRCDSPNTKFCYYNNYSLSQPRYYCKTCRRYWTNGGTLRNIPIGGGCRKQKKIKSNSRVCYDPKETSSRTSNLKYLHGGYPSMEFHLGGHPFSRFNSSITSNVYNQFPSAIVNNKPSCFDMDPSANSTSSLPFSYLGSSSFKQEEIGRFNVGTQEMSSMTITNCSPPASSIQSLSIINQDMHWRLQQQRLEEMLSEENHQKEILKMSNPEVSVAGNTRKSGSLDGNITREWFFENPNCTLNSTTNSVNNGEGITSNWSGIETWSDLHQYAVLPQ